MKMLLLLGLLLPTLAAAQTTTQCEPQAQELREAKTSQRLAALLKEKNFSAIEDELTDKLKRYESGEYSDLSLFWDITATVSGNRGLEPLLQEWVNTKPDSFFAHVLKGEHHASVGYDKRGGDFASATSKEQFEAMEVEFQKARGSFEKAAKLRAQSALPLAGMIAVGKASDGIERIRDLLAKANRIDRANTSARWTAVHAMAPKWLGSFEELDAIARDAARAQLPDPRVRYLRYAIEMRKADHFSTITKEKTKAMVHWRNAAQLCPNARPWRLLGSAAYDLEDWATLKQASSNLLVLTPRDGATVARRGWADEQMGQMSSALKDYALAAEFGDAWAQNRLGYFLMVGQHVPKDLTRARKLLEASAAQGNLNARGNLEALGK